MLLGATIIAVIIVMTVLWFLTKSGRRGEIMNTAICRKPEAHRDDGHYLVNRLPEGFGDTRSVLIRLEQKIHPNAR